MVTQKSKKFRVIHVKWCLGRFVIRRNRFWTLTTSFGWVWLGSILAEHGGQIELPPSDFVRKYQK